MANVRDAPAGPRHLPLQDSRSLDREGPGHGCEPSGRRKARRSLDRRFRRDSGEREQVTYAAGGTPRVREGRAELSGALRTPFVGTLRACHPTTDAATDLSKTA